MAQWLSDHSFDFAGCLRVYAVGEDGVTAFTDQASNASSKIIADERAAGRAPHPIKSSE
jgi:hypothetical protein